MEGPHIQRIRRLPSQVINQIAAGEVIERPVSVVKELLENSLDAGARHITVEVSGGGRRLRVMDDGHGIHANDLVLAVDRHTTSKLGGNADLARIATLGFRGEALCSIAAVSRLTLTSRQADAPHGCKLALAADGREPEIRPAPHPVGTTVEVSDLFYNTPARRKFLRSDHSEYLHILDLVKRVALCRTDVGLRLAHNGRQTLQLTASLQEPEARMQAVLGKGFADHCIPLSAHAGEYAMHGWLGQPEHARSESDQQYFYLNGRIIRDKLINHAVRLACQDRLHPGRQPSYLLYLVMDAGLVDVNVHPAKHEVRFRDPRNVHDFIHATLAQALRADSGSSHSPASLAAAEKYTARAEQPAPHVAEAMAEYPQSTTGAAQVLALVEGRYIVAEEQPGLVVVDSLRARELVAYHAMTRAYENGGVRSRPVLVPLMLPATQEDMASLDRYQDLLERMGLVLRPGGPATVLVRELPSALAQADAAALVGGVLQSLRDPAMEGERALACLKLMAGHANDAPPSALSRADMQLLLTELDSLRPLCSGTELRSTWRRFSLRDLEDLFATRR